MSIWSDAIGPKRRPGLARVRANQKLISERLGWPDGALQTCWDLENRFPGWHVSWLGENTNAGFERPAGYWATWDLDSHHVEVFREDVRELAEQLAEGVPEHVYGIRGCSWCAKYSGTRRAKL